MAAPIPGTTDDVVQFLLDQHNEVKRLFSAVASSSGKAREEAFECLVRLLAVHETAEEEVMHPLARRTVDDGNAVVDARLAEESEAKSMLSELERDGVDAPDFDARFDRFRTAVLAHAEAEEQFLFEPMRTKLDDDERKRLASMMVTAEKMAPTHPHPHGPESALGNMLVGPFVAIADRMRDAFHELRQGTDRR